MVVVDTLKLLYFDMIFNLRTDSPFEGRRKTFQIPYFIYFVFHVSHQRFTRARLSTGHGIDCQSDAQGLWMVRSMARDQGTCNGNRNRTKAICKHVINMHHPKFSSKPGQDWICGLGANGLRCNVLTSRRNENAPSPKLDTECWILHLWNRAAEDPANCDLTNKYVYCWRTLVNKSTNYSITLWTERKLERLFLFSTVSTLAASNYGQNMRILWLSIFCPY